MKQKQESQFGFNKQTIMDAFKKIPVTPIICFFVLIQINSAFSQNDQQNIGGGNGNGTLTPTTTAFVLQPGIGLRYNVNKKIRLYQDFRTYFNQSNSTKNFEELSFGARYNIGRVNRFFFSSTLGYLFTLDKNYKISVYRPKIYFTTSYRLNKIRFEFRNRFEYQIVTSQNSGGSLRYRPRFKVGLRYNFKQFQLSPYIYNEFFWGQNGFSQNRTKLALSVKYYDFRFTAGNLLKTKPGLGLIENRMSLNISYTIPSTKKNKSTNDKH